MYFPKVEPKARVGCRSCCGRGPHSGQRAIRGSAVSPHLAGDPRSCLGHTWHEDGTLVSVLVSLCPWASMAWCFRLPRGAWVDIGGPEVLRAEWLRHRYPWVCGSHPMCWRVDQGTCRSAKPQVPPVNRGSTCFSLQPCLGRMAQGRVWHQKRRLRPQGYHNQAQGKWLVRVLGPLS